MSRETSQWLNQNVLVGFTSKRGNAWHYKSTDQGTEPNHYEQAIPVEDVKRRLFHWKAIEAPVFVQVPKNDAHFAYKYIQQDDRKAIVRDDTYETLGLFKDS